MSSADIRLQEKWCSMEPKGQILLQKNSLHLNLAILTLLILCFIMFIIIE